MVSQKETSPGEHPFFMVILFLWFQHPKDPWGLVYLPTNLPSKSTIHVGIDMPVPWILWAMGFIDRQTHQHFVVTTCSKIASHRIESQIQVLGQTTPPVSYH